MPGKYRYFPVGANLSIGYMGQAAKNGLPAFSVVSRLHVLDSQTAINFDDSTCQVVVFKNMNYALLNMAGLSSLS